MKPAKNARHANFLRTAMGKYPHDENNRAWPQNVGMGKPSREDRRQKRGWTRGRR